MSTNKNNLYSPVELVQEKDVVIVSTSKRSKSKSASVVIVIIILISCVLGYTFSKYTSNESELEDQSDNHENQQNENQNNQPNENDTNDGEDEWWMNYTPAYSEGSGNDDWWIEYPDQHPDAGSSVNHPQWVLDSLEDKPVVILVHSEQGCEQCVEQQNDMVKVLQDYGEDVVYYDITSESDAEKAYSAFKVYDPNDEMHNIPLTIIVSLIEDDLGNVDVSWHSAEGSTGDDWIRGYTMDSIYYHHNNIEEWGG